MQSSSFLFVFLTFLCQELIDDVDASNNFNMTQIFSIHTKKIGAPLVITSPPHTSNCDSYLLSWKPLESYHQPEAKAYYIKYKAATRPSSGWSYIRLKGSITNHSISNLERQTVYQVEVIGQNNNAVLSRPAMSSFRTGCVKNTSNDNNHENNVIDNHKSKEEEALSVPLSPSLTVTDTSRSSISLMWYPTSNGGSPVEGYRVQIKVKGKSWKSRWVAADTRTYDFTGLKKGVDYKFRVIAVNNVGESPPSASAKFRHPKVKDPLAPHISHAVLKNRTIICITLKSWDVLSDIDGYLLYILEDERVVNKQKFSSDFNQALCASINFVSGRSYKVKMQSYAVGAKSGFSNELHFKFPSNFQAEMIVLDNSDSYDETTHDNDDSNVDVSQYPDAALNQMSQRDLAILLAGITLFIIIIILSISAFVYHRLLNKEKRLDQTGNPDVWCNSRKKHSKNLHCSQTVPCHHHHHVNHHSKMDSCIDHHHHQDLCYQCDAMQHSEPMWWGRDGEFGHIVPQDESQHQFLPVSTTVPQHNVLAVDNRYQNINT